MGCLGDFFRGYKTTERQLYRGVVSRSHEGSSSGDSDDLNNSTHSARKYLATYDIFKQSILSMDTSENSQVDPLGSGDEREAGNVAQLTYQPPPALAGQAVSGPAMGVVDGALLSKSPSGDDEYGNHMFPKLQPENVSAPVNSYNKDAQAVGVLRSPIAPKPPNDAFPTPPQRKVKIHTGPNPPPLMLPSAIGAPAPAPALPALPQAVAPGTQRMGRPVESDPSPHKGSRELPHAHHSHHHGKHDENHHKKKKKYDEWMYQLDELAEQYGHPTGQRPENPHNDHTSTPKTKTERGSPKGG